MNRDSTHHTRFSYHSKVGPWKRNAEVMEKGMMHSCVAQCSRLQTPAHQHGPTLLLSCCLKSVWLTQMQW